MILLSKYIVKFFKVLVLLLIMEQNQSDELSLEEQLQRAKDLLARSDAMYRPVERIYLGIADGFVGSSMGLVLGVASYWPVVDESIVLSSFGAGFCIGFIHGLIYFPEYCKEIRETAMKRYTNSLSRVFE